MFNLIDVINQAISGQYELNSIEFKKCSTDCPALYETLSSFSNQDNGGCIVLGIDEKNDFKPIAIKDIQKCVAQAQQQCHAMEPEVNASIEVVPYGKVHLICISVPGIGSAQRPCFIRKNGVFNGSYVRVGDGDIHMSATEVHNYLNFRQQTSDDIQPCGGPDDLDPTAIESFLIHLAESHPKLYGLGREKALNLLRVSNQGSSTLAAQLMFGVYPQQFLPCAVINAACSQGTVYASTLPDGQRFIDSQRLDGNISDMLKGALAFVRRNTRMAIVVDPATAMRADRPEYPETAIRELLLNALLHRDYSRYTSGEAISLNLFADRLEITNPGGIYGGYSLQSIEEHYTRSLRNPVLTSLVEMSGLTENRGTGLAVAAQAMSARGLPSPKYEVVYSHFKATLFNNQAAPVTSYFNKA